MTTTETMLAAQRIRDYVIGRAKVRTLNPQEVHAVYDGDRKPLTITDLCLLVDAVLDPDPDQPYQGQVNCGRLVCRLGHYRDDRTGELVAYSQVRVTANGLRALHERLGGTAALVALDTVGGAR